MWWEIPNHLKVQKNSLFIAGFDPNELVKKYGSPLYVYNGNRIIENFNAIKNAFGKQGVIPRIHYAVKANSHIQILRMLLSQGAWIDCVSPNEAKLALKAGFPKEKILFTGTSVANNDLRELIELGVVINIDSFSQMRRLAKFNFKGDVSIRWNPGTGAGLHDHTITAGEFIKFGIPEHKISDAFKEAKKLGLNLVGLHQHIGSGWLGNDVNVFLDTVKKTLLVAKNAQEILEKNLEFVDFGGGPGIRYKSEQKSFPIDVYAKGIIDRFKNSGITATIAIEPGRFIVGDAGVLLVEANTVEEKNIPVIGVNAGFNTLVRPAFYGSYHEIINVNNAGSIKTEKFMVAGNLCESSDVFNTSKQELREIPVPKEGDILALLNAGAYGFSMASSYNMRCRPAEVMLLDGKDHLITERETFYDLIKNQKTI